MTRKERILQEALRIHNDDDVYRFIAGAEWADNNPDRSETSDLGIALAALHQIMNTGTTWQYNTQESIIAYETLGKLGYWDEKNS